MKEKLLNVGRRPHDIPVGGSSSLGTWGHIKFDDIVLACCNVGTIAGLSLGSSLSTLDAKVHVFSICYDPDYIYNFIQGLLDGLEADVNSHDIVNIQNAKDLG